MLKGARVILMLALVAGSARGLGAQELAQLCRSASQVAVGQWASYTRGGGQDEGAQVRFAIVSSERRGDSTLYWFEIKSSGAPNVTHNGIVQVLVPGFGAELVGIRAMVLQQGDQPAMRFPDEMVSMLGQQVGQNNPALGIVMHCASARVIGWENVVTPAGSIRALHVADPEGMEAWRVPNVPFGFVKVRMKDGAMMTLTSQGAGATSSLVGMP
jgi:hypothetical protein